MALRGLTNIHAGSAALRMREEHLDLGDSSRSADPERVNVVFTNVP